MNNTVIILVCLLSHILLATVVNADTYQRPDTAQNAARDLMVDKGCLRTQTVMRAGDEYKVTEDADGKVWIEGGRLEVVCAEWLYRNILIRFKRPTTREDGTELLPDEPLVYTVYEIIDGVAELIGLTENEYYLLENVPLGYHTYVVTASDEYGDSVNSDSQTILVKSN